MPKFSFRIRFHRSLNNTLNIDAHRWEWRKAVGDPPIVLTCQPDGELIKNASIWVFKSEGWPSEEAARHAAERYGTALSITLARLRIGADFGIRSPKSGFFRAGLEMLEKESGFRVLNDVHGLMLYESEPTPRFVKLEGKGTRGVPPRHFESVFARALANIDAPADREKLALELFNASFFQHTTDSRFIVLIMAVEALASILPKSTAAVAHVESMIRMTQESESLAPEEIKSLVSSLEWLKLESINHAGRRLAAERLGARRYMDKEAASFFSYCYGLRSRLVHGKHPQPIGGELGSAVSELEIFVSDLLSGPLRDMVLT